MKHPQFGPRDLTLKPPRPYAKGLPEYLRKGFEQSARMSNNLLVQGPPPAMSIPRDQRGDKAEKAISVAGCARQLCLPNPAGAAWDLVPGALKKDVDRPEASCICWSDFWFYGGGTLLTVLGLFMLFGGGFSAGEQSE